MNEPKPTEPTGTAVRSSELLGHVKQDVSDILMSALNGQDGDLRYDNGQFIRWGLVEKRIHAAIEAKWPNAKLCDPLKGNNECQPK